ncbi:MAG: hypothetical protein ACK4PI_07935 [Tepidisphaerales bacterium]
MAWRSARRSGGREGGCVAMSRPLTGCLHRAAGQARAVHCCVLVGLLTAGCALPPPVPGAAGRGQPATWQVTGPDGNVAGSSGGLPSLGEGGSRDPAPAARFGARMDVWAVSVPRGAVSANEAFWKRVDEEAISPERYERLFVNGFRVGVGRADQWEYFRDLLSRHPARHQLNAVTAFDETSVEVPVRRGVDTQTLGYFGPDGLELRTFDRSDNVIALSFVPAPRRADAARIALTPVVRSSRGRLELSDGGPGRETTFRSVRPERLYDLSLAVEVPFGQFLVVSPSTDAVRATSIGRNFLLMDRDSEQNELVLIIVPTRVELREAATSTAPATSAEPSGPAPSPTGPRTTP